MITLSILSMLIILIILEGGQDDQGYQDCQGDQDHQDDRAPGNASLARPRLTSPLTIAACVKRFCLECVGATTGRAAFDCGSKVCPLRPASPFLGKPLPLTMRADDYEGEPTRVAKRRPSRMIIHAQCRQCQPGDRTDCEATDCALYAYRPWDGPGKADRRKASQAQIEAAARGRESMRQKASTAVGAAFDG